ncbi:MAG: GDSL-type esterase/lipase family protein [Salinivirgaceae bacterium]
MRELLFLFCLFFFSLKVSPAQDYPYDIDQYPFIHYRSNRLTQIKNAPGFAAFYSKWQNIVVGKDTKLEILHLGDSHIQADFFTGRVRQRVQSFSAGAEGARGIVFPYNLAETNNPGNYIIESENNWQVVNALKISDSKTGIIPLKLTTTDSLIKLRVTQKDDAINTEFNEIEFWYHASDTVNLLTPGNQVVHLKKGYGRVALTLTDFTKEAELTLYRLGDSVPFELFAVWLKNSLPGITYHALGLNGARAKDFVLCDNLSRFLQFVTPDVIVISLGTNDIYSNNPDLPAFREYYSRLIADIRKVFPEKAIILTTPGDHFVHRAAANVHVEEAGQIIKDIAREHQCAVWDFYEIMGGYESVSQWRRYGLGAKDLVHLSPKGYRLQGDLFFNALLRYFEKQYFPAKNE